MCRPCDCSVKLPVESLELNDIAPVHCAEKICMDFFQLHQFVL